MKILLTGATGFIGKHLIGELVANNHYVIATMRPDSQLPDMGEDAKVDWILADEGLQNAIEKHQFFDAIIHLATNYARSGGLFVGVEDANVLFPLRLLDFAMQGGANLFINADTFFSRESYNYAYMREYTASKQNFTRWGRLATEINSDLCFINARLEHVYGPNDSPGKFIPFIVDGILRGDPDLKLSPCVQRRDFVHVFDVVEAFKVLLENRHGLCGFVEMGIGSGCSVPISCMVEKVKEISGSETNLIFGALPLREGEIMDSFSDNRLIRNLGWSQKVDLFTGLEMLIKERRAMLGCIR